MDNKIKSQRTKEGTKEQTMANCTSIWEEFYVKILAFYLKSVPDQVSERERTNKAAFMAGDKPT